MTDKQRLDFMQKNFVHISNGFFASGELPDFWRVSVPLRKTGYIDDTLRKAIDRAMGAK